MVEFEPGGFPPDIYDIPRDALSGIYQLLEDFSFVIRKLISDAKVPIVKEINGKVPIPKYEFAVSDQHASLIVRRKVVGQYRVVKLAIQLLPQG